MWVGLAPWNFLVCEAGSKISELKNKGDILTLGFYAKILGLASFCVGLILVKRNIMKSKNIIHFKGG